MISYLTSLLFSFLLLMSNPVAQKESIADYDRKIAAIDKLALNSKKKVLRVPSWLNKGKIIFMTLYYKDSTALKLEYPTFEVSGDFLGNDYIYFDESGKMYAGVMNDNNNKFISVFIGNHASANYTRESGGNLSERKQDSKFQKYHEQDYTYMVDFYMQFFPSFKYFRDAPAPDAPPVLRTKRGNVALLDAPGGNPILTLKENVYVNYLDRSEKQLEYNGQKWLFLKVTTTNKKITGWIWGNPAIIDDGGEE